MPVLEEINFFIMMRNTLSFILCLLCSYAFAQPVGQLYVQSGQGRTAALSYIDYPSETVHNIEFREMTDLVASPDYLYASALYNLGEVYVYDRSNHQRTTTLTNTEARFLELWGDKLVVGSFKAPFLRVYDPAQAYAESFSLLDSTVVPQAPQDMLVAGDRAYLLLNESLVIVDLDLEDTLAVIPTPPPYLNQNQNTSIVDGGEYVYIMVDYVTGALRSSLLQVNKLTLQVKTAFHNEGMASQFPPVAAGDSVFVYEYSSHYDASDDSLYIYSSPSQYFAYAMAYEPISDVMFTYGGILTPTQIQYYHQGQASTGVAVSAVQHLHFASSGNTAIDSDALTRVSCSIFPNPTVDFLNIIWAEDKKLEYGRILNPKGQVVWEKNYDQSVEKAQIDVRDLSHGGYFLELQFDEGKMAKPFVKW